MDRLTELTAFVRTVDRGSQAAAARELGLTPAMVGRYLRTLEDRLGARLLNRTTTSQSLTEAGTIFHARATAILDQLDAAEAAVADRDASPRGRLRLTAPMVFGTRYLAPWLAEFHARYPHVQIELTLNDRHVDLVEEGYDMALRIGALAESALIARRLAPCRTLVCAAPSYLARRGTPSTPEDLAAHDCLTYTYAANGPVWRFTGPGGRRVAIPVAGPLAANNGDALTQAAIGGAGIVIQPTFILGDAVRAGTLIPILPDWHPPSLAIHAVYPSPRHLTPKVRALIAHLATQLGDNPIWDQDL